MGDVWLAPTAIYDGAALRNGAVLQVQNGQTGAIVARGDLPKTTQILPLDGTLCAGFLDCQVNGGGGVLLNNTPTAQAIGEIAAAHRRAGTVGILPTVITDSPHILAQAVDAAIAARANPAVLGLHIEGPHLAPARRGTHSAQWLRPFEAETLAHVTRLRAAGMFVKITLAPEMASAADVAALVATGAVVSIGHSDASAEDTRALLMAGATCFTHLFNAMSPMTARAAGVTGAALNSEAYCGIICDGIHVADEMIALALRARPVAGRMVMVSDAMATVQGPDHFTLYGRKISLQNGRLINDEGALAGAHCTMASGVQRLVTGLKIAPETVLDMAISAPARVLRRPELASPCQRDLRDILLLGPSFALAAMGQDILTEKAR